jgi:nitrite reductase/ring-hydroxylating ferredoxin subunit
MVCPYITTIQLAQGYNYAHVYQDPNSGSAVLKRLVTGDKITVTCRKHNGFMRVQTGAVNGWIKLR